MKYLLIIILFIVGCSMHEQKIVPTTNDNYTVGLLFEVEGCKVYAARTPGGDNLYFTNCSGSTQWNESRGKTVKTITVNGGK